MENEKKEIRMLPMRELRVDSSDGGNEIIGHAAVFDSWSETLGGFFPFKEKVRKGAFVKSIIDDDIRALFNHDPNYVLGRNKVGTLALEEDDISQMSIGFLVEEDKWSTDSGLDTRELIKVKLFDVSTVTFPAYAQTDVGVRAMDEYRGYKEEQKKAKVEAEDALKKAKEIIKLNSLKTKFKNL